MAAVPLLEETSGGPAGAMVSGLAGLRAKPIPPISRSSPTTDPSASSPSTRPLPASTWSRNWTICAPARSNPTSSSTRASSPRRCQGLKTVKCASL
ncbi:hypothetical protein AJ88_44050 [Mesorhizobium amorphae CCBAU 01583]|nr:hypothetical protein AJ88_44050 [Mesorhizobium amorphae CCBAU 01583]